MDDLARAKAEGEARRQAGGEAERKELKRRLDEALLKLGSARQESEGLRLQVRELELELTRRHSPKKASQASRAAVDAAVSEAVGKAKRQFTRQVEALERLRKDAELDASSAHEVGGKLLRPVREYPCTSKVLQCAFKCKLGTHGLGYSRSVNE